MQSPTTGVWLGVHSYPADMVHSERSGDSIRPYTYLRTSSRQAVIP